MGNIDVGLGKYLGHEGAKGSQRVKGSQEDKICY